MLTFRHRNYPFTVQGLSLGFTAGASVNKLVGRAEHMDELRDFSGAYSVVGAGAALFGGIGGVQLKNDKGVIITLQGPKAGVEVSANVTQRRDHSRSIPFNPGLEPLEKVLMKSYRVRLFAAAALTALFAAGLTSPSKADTGAVQVVFTKGGFIVGAGSGRGVLVFKGHRYPFRVGGMSVGFTSVCRPPISEATPST